MKCPKCSREIPFDAMDHGSCGWKLPSRAHEAAAKAATTRVAKARAPLPPEIRAALDAALKKWRVVAQEKIGARPLGQPHMREVTPGHGHVCCCQLCWPHRVKGPRSYAKSKLGDEDRGPGKEKGYDEGK